MRDSEAVVVAVNGSVTAVALGVLRGDGLGDGTDEVLEVVEFVGEVSDVFVVSEFDFRRLRLLLIAFIATLLRPAVAFSELVRVWAREVMGRVRGCVRLGGNG